MTADAIEPPTIRSIDLLKPEQAAKILGMSKSFLRELTLAGRVPGIDFGMGRKHMWRYHAPTLNAWLQKQTRPLSGNPQRARKREFCDTRFPS